MEEELSVKDVLKHAGIIQSEIRCSDVQVSTHSALTRKWKKRHSAIVKLVKGEVAMAWSAGKDVEFYAKWLAKPKSEEGGFAHLAFLFIGGLCPPRKRTNICSLSTVKMQKNVFKECQRCRRYGSL